MQIMTERRIRHLPVIGRTARMIGMISIGDLVRAVIEEQDQTIEQLERSSRAEPLATAGVAARPRAPRRRTIRRSLTSGMQAPLAPSLAVDFCGLRLASPIVLLSGCVGFGEEYTRVEGFSNRDAGAIVLKGTTREPRLGNPPHRVYETPMGMLNAIGLQNPGADHVVDRILPTLDFTETASSPTSAARRSRTTSR